MEVICGALATGILVYLIIHILFYEESDDEGFF